MTITREGIAHHESGHIVACVKNDVEVEFATIKPGDDSLGRVKYGKILCDGDFEWDHSPEAVDRAERLMLITLAGPFAQRRFAPRIPYRNRSDFGLVDALISHSQRNDWRT